jgi:hypothetical protein
MAQGAYPPKNLGCSNEDNYLRLLNGLAYQLLTLKKVFRMSFWFNLVGQSLPKLSPSFRACSIKLFFVLIVYL